MRIGITITKDTLFRGVQQEFHNIYHFNLITAVTAPSQTLVDDLVATEKANHSSVVNFKRAQVWTAGGTKAENQMIHQQTLTGTGTGATAVGLDKERAVLIRWPAGFDSRGLPVYLRKYYHACGSFGGIQLSGTALLENTGGFTDAQRTSIANAANEVRSIGTNEFWQLCAKTGRDTTGAAQAHRYLEHHQLGDMWR